MPKLKAYEVRDGEEGHCVIAFSTSNAAARRKGADKLDLDWESIESCRRAPAFDAYAPGPVPPTVLLEHGWWQECLECGRRCEHESYDDDHDEELNPVDHGDQIFCTPRCQGVNFAKARANTAARAAMVELVLTRFPGCTIKRVHVYGERLEKSEPGHGLLSTAEFTFPGAQYGASYHFGDPAVYVSNVDVEVFKALYAPEPIHP